MSQNEIISLDDLLAYLEALFPNACCELCYKNDYELLISIILSAQTTDKHVNLVSKDLFAAYKDFSSLAMANVLDISLILKPLGLANVKANNIIRLAKDIMLKYNGEIPKERFQLMELSGIGYKSATLYLTMKGYINSFAVDTHIKRVANRLGLSKEENPIKISLDLEKYFSGLVLDKIHHQMIFFGRYICKAKNPLCKDCKLKVKCFKIC